MEAQHVMNPYRERDHGTFDEEWAPHKKTSGWWYITGYLTDKEHPDHLFSYQYTVIQARMFGITSYLLQVAFTDFQTNSHLFKQIVQARRGKNVRANHDEVVYAPYASLRKEQDKFVLATTTDEFDLHLELNKGKGASWHCDNGVLVMGLPDDLKQRTVYYSYTNMPTKGGVVIRDKLGQERTLEMVGKSWLDRQWGPYRLMDADSHWEWFSLRFFDDEEVMLFTFPQHPYLDGTYIDKQGHTKQLREYECKPKELIKVDDYTFSKGWDVVLPGIKEGHYEIRPIMDGQLNLAYFELMAEILNAKKERVGYCFVELLSGARNKLSLMKSIGNMMRKV